MKKLIPLIILLLSCNNTAPNVRGSSEMVYSDSDLKAYNKRVDTMIQYLKSKGYKEEDIIIINH